ncbi:MAG: VWA domain-containing protein, partial [Candidatus Acidiferrales bacterium]
MPVFAQGQPAGPLQMKPGVQVKQPPPLPQNQKPTRFIVRVVTLPVAVANGSGKAVLDLAQKDFQIFEDGKPEQITHFDQGGDPLSIVLVIETSSRVEPLLPEISKSGIIFTQMVMAGNGEAAVIGYNDEVDLLRPMTTDSDRILDAINHIKPGLDGARLYDALERAEDILEAEPRERRRIIVVIGEKNDKGSETALGQVLRRAQLTNTTIYSIGLSTTAAEFRQPPQQKKDIQAGPTGT